MNPANIQNSQPKSISGRVSGTNQTDDSRAPNFVAPRESGAQGCKGVVSVALDTRFRGYDGGVRGYQPLEWYH